MIATERMWLTASGEVVGEGHPDAATLLCGVGQEVPAGYDGKAVAPPSNKATKTPANKAG